MDLKNRMHQIEAMFSEMLLKMDEHSADITSLKKDIADLKLEASRNRTFQKEVALAFAKQAEAIAQQSDNIQYLLEESIEIKETQLRLLQDNTNIKETQLQLLQDNTGIKETQLRLESKIDILDSFLRDKLS